MVNDNAPTIDIRPLLEAFYRGRVPIVAGFLVGVLGGFAGWYFSGVQYDAVATLAVNQPRSAPSASAPTSTASYSALIQNHRVVTQALADAGVDLASSGIRPVAFMHQAVSVAEVRGTNLVRVTVRMADPTLAAKIAQAVAVRAVELSRTLNQQEGSSMRDQLKGQAQDAADRLRAAEAALLAYKRTSQVELLRSEVESLAKQHGRLIELQVDLSGAVAKTAVAAEELASRPSKLSFQRTIDRDPALTEAARSATGGDSRALLGLGLKSEEPNPAYQELDQEVALGRALVAELEQQRKQILTSSTQLTKAGKLVELYEKEIELDRRQADVALARKVYQDVAGRYEQARVVVTSSSAQLQIVDDAVVLPNPISWPLSRWLAIGAFIGLVVPLGFIGVGMALRYARSGLTSGS